MADIDQCGQISRRYNRPGFLVTPQEQQAFNACMNWRSAQHQAQDQQKAREDAMNKEISPLLQRASAGDAAAAFQVSQVYGRYGQSSDQTQWLYRAAQAGLVPAEVQLGDLNATRNPDEALKWYDRAAATGDGHAALEAQNIRSMQAAAAKQARLAADKAARMERVAKLIDGIVTKDSTGWANDKYQPGSLRDVSILSNQRRVMWVEGHFSYLASFQQASNPWVRVKFVDYLPACVIYWNFPNECRPING